MGIKRSDGSAQCVLDESPGEERPAKSGRMEGLSHDAIINGAAIAI